MSTRPAAPRRTNLLSALDPRSLRWKIAALAAAASCAVAVSVGVLVHTTTYEWSLNTGRTEAVQAVLHAASGIGGQDAPDAVIDDPAALPPELLRQVTPREPATWYDDTKPDEPWMWAAVRTGGRVLAVKIDMGAERRSLQALDRHIVMATLAVLAIVVPLAALAAELPNRRLRRVAGTARRIAGGDLDARTGAGGRPRDEIGEISAAVDSMASALQERLLAEQRFTADVAHELRTPLMGLVTSAELLPEGEVTELVRDRVAVLRALVEDLLEISRLDAGAERADHVPVPLGEVVRESVRRTGLAARVEVTGHPVADTDPRRLDRIIANLVANAHRHGRPPVEVGVRGTTIVVRDHGPGFHGTLLAEGPRRFRTGAEERGRGHGLGLTIALGQARVIGADLGFANAPDGGAVATVRLGAEPRSIHGGYTAARQSSGR
ncbi:two-component sensor histidine kinase [Microbispora rosea subsp. aerata]|nr:HAMP domain-containing sensor histidine kinase [Microbispora rosea]GGO17461.1 two-component sensor histidine kinase [Microbispora rosea subsp. aerata]GIH56548.1 two-component sensor histidine kinase [Microbispora rosea subsp. aerata]GLJ81923.1 two-component sensor histidine kinase [Microbispora rosea subsp. aerata]